jgi:hypothetical protein
MFYYVAQNEMIVPVPHQRPTIRKSCTTNFCIGQFPNFHDDAYPQSGGTV